MRAHSSQPRATRTTAPRIKVHTSQDVPQAGHAAYDAAEENSLADSALLPRLDPSVARVLNRIHASGSTFEFRAGDVVWHASWDANPAPLAMPRRYRFQLGDASGHLALDALAERTLLGDAATDMVPPDLRSLLLADALEAVFPVIERHTGLPFQLILSEDQDAAPVQPQSAYAHLLVHEQASRTTFRCAIHFDDERHLGLLCPAVTAPRPVAAEDWNWIPVPLAFRLGTTALKLEELRRIAPGDIVRIDLWRAVGKGLVVSASLPGTARCAITAHAVDAKIIVDRIEENTLSTTKTEDTLAERIHPDVPLNDLEALEVTLTFELGAHTVSLGELRSLRPGHAIELAQPLQRSTIRIVANGRSVGSGYLIALGDKLGIRVSEFAKNDDV